MKKKYLAYISSVYIFLFILGLKSEYCEKQSLELDYLNEFSSNENNYTPHTLLYHSLCHSLHGVNIKSIN